MKSSGLLAGGMFMLALLSLTGVNGRTENQNPAPNRSGLCRAVVSSVRLARLEEIPRTKNVTANVKLSPPNLRPRWVARYAIDGSPLTRWASAETPDEMPWIELTVGNRLRPRVMVRGLTIAWGTAWATKYRVMASSDGSFLKLVHQHDRGGGGTETITFDTPVPARMLRIEVQAKSSSSIEIIDLQVFGDPEEAAPAPIKNLKASVSGSDRLRLTWEQADEVTAFYRVYRAEGAPPKAIPEFEVALVDAREYEARGLTADREYQFLVVPESYGGRVGLGAATKARTTAGDQFFRFPLRGVVEGFYNDPWPHQERLRMIEFLAGHGYNYYIYAPKLDPYHRQLWREPYPAAELKNFHELVTRGNAIGVTLNYGLSPGLDINLSSASDLKLLRKKLRAMYEAGFRAFTLCLDDIPGDESAGRSMAEGQVKMVNEVFAFLRGLDPNNQLVFVPTVYSHTPSWWRPVRKGAVDYLTALTGIDPAVGIMWTGPQEVFSQTISLGEAGELARLWNRKILIWDNYPVNDLNLRFNIFTGPYLGRAPDLSVAVNGIMLNPMFLPHASKIALYTAGVYMTRRDYDPWATYEEALNDLAPTEDGRAALKAVSDCLTPHPVFAELNIERTPIYLAVADFWRTRGTGSNSPEEQRLRVLFTAYSTAPRDLGRLGDVGLADDLLPPAAKLALYGQAGLKCLELLSTRDPDRLTGLRAEVLRLQAQARLNPWFVADERTTLSTRYLGGRILERNVLDDFITRSLATVRPQ